MTITLEALPISKQTGPNESVVEKVDLNTFDGWMYGNPECIARQLGYEYTDEFLRILETLRDMYKVENAITNTISQLGENMFRSNRNLRRIPAISIASPVEQKSTQPETTDRKNTKGRHPVVVHIHHLLRIKQ